MKGRPEQKRCICSWYGEKTQYGYPAGNACRRAMAAEYRKAEYTGGRQFMRTGAVIVAAGMSTRMGDLKQLMKIGDLTLAERVVVNFRRVGVKDIVVVTGCQAEQVEKSLGHSGVVFVRNEKYRTTQMLDSAKLGLDYLKERCERIFFCPVDVPFFTENTLKALMEPEGELVVPLCGGKPGHPVRIGASLVPSILRYQGEGGLRGALDFLGVEQVSVEVHDEGAVTDADTREDFQHLVEIHNARLMRGRVKVWPANRG